MVLCAPSANTAIVKSIEAMYRRWTISYHPAGGGYALKFTGSNGLALKPADPGSYPGLNAEVRGYSASSTSFNWTLLRLASPPAGVLLYELSSGKSINAASSRYITAGTSKTLEELDFAAYAYSGNSAASEEIHWYCVSGSSYLNINSTTGKITGLSPGTAVVRGSSTYGYFDLNITVTRSTSSDYTFIHQYDSSFTEDPELLGYIDDAVSFVNTAYQNQFSISVSSSTSPYYRDNSITDDCPVESYASCHSYSVCGDSCNTSHHKNVYRISDQFYSSTIPQDHVVVFWTDRDLTSYCKDGNRIVNSYAGVCYHRPVIHMRSIDDKSSRKQKCMAINLAHELAHTLGLDEKYNTAPHNTSSGYCVMAYYPTEDDILDTFYKEVFIGHKKLFCSSCEAEIEELLAG